MGTLLGELTFFRGDSYPIEITLKVDDVAVDITGYSFKLTVDTEQDPPDGTTKVFDVVGVLDADPTTGKVSFTPTEEDSDQEPEIYYYDIEMIDSDANKRTIAKDKFTIEQDITKS